VNDREILVATLRWHTAHEARRAIGTEHNRFKTEQKKNTGFGGADYEISRRVTAAKRVELAALRELAKVCVRVRSNQKQVVDAKEIIDVEVKMLSL
jgi:hypothetical protein